MMHCLSFERRTAFLAAKFAWILMRRFQIYNTAEISIETVISHARFTRLVFAHRGCYHEETYY